MTDQTSFSHETLQLPTHIRLLELLPSENIDDDISCRVRIVDLEESPLYEAVSYVWGSEDDKAKILCGGSALLVPRNLIAALRRFRQSTTPRLLWADSICINQADIQEKNHQVRIMGRVYAGAAKVLIWLGDAEWEESKQVLQGLDTLIELHNSGRLDELGLVEQATLSRNQNDINIHNLISNLFDTPTGASTELRAIMGMFARGWFRRAWTFQESLLANSRRFFLGSLEIGADSLQVAIYTLAKLYMAPITKVPPLLLHCHEDVVQSVAMLTPRGTYDQHATFRNLLSYRRGSGCKYAVDLVYSILEVTKATMSIVPDYNKDFPQVFAEAMLVMISADVNLAVLGEVEIVPRSTTSELPSWMPDWRIANKGGILGFDSHLFSCAGTTEPIITISSNSRNLTTSGFAIDSIRELLLPEEVLRNLKTRDFVLGVAWLRNLCCDRDIFGPRDARTKRWDQSTCDRYHAMIAQCSQSGGTKTEFSALIERVFLDSMYERVMKTRCGGKGVAPTNAEPGDIVTVLFGGQVPVLLRPTANPNEFLFVGQCYVDQMMDGEAMEQLANVQNRAACRKMSRLLKRCSGIFTGLARSGNPNLLLYQVRDFVLV